MGYLHNIIADARPRAATRGVETTAYTNDMATTLEGTGPAFSAQQADSGQVSEAAAPVPHVSGNSSSGARIIIGPLQDADGYGDRRGRGTHSHEMNREIGGEVRAEASGSRRAVPPFGYSPETEQNMYSRLSRTASNAEEETETSASRPGGSRIHETESEGEDVSSGGEQSSKRTSNTLESVMTMQEIPDTMEESETRTSSSNSRGENGMFLRKQRGNMPSGGFSASPPSFFLSENKFDRADLSQKIIENDPQRARVPAGEIPLYREKNSRHQKKLLRPDLQQVETGISGNRKPEEVNPGNAVSFRNNRPQHRERKEHKPLRALEPEPRLINGINGIKKQPASLVEQREVRPQESNVTIGRIEVIIEAPGGGANQPQAPSLSSSSLSSRRYLRRL